MTSSSRVSGSFVGVASGVANGIDRAVSAPRARWPTVVLELSGQLTARTAWPALGCGSRSQSSALPAASGLGCRSRSPAVRPQERVASSARGWVSPSNDGLPRWSPHATMPTFNDPWRRAGVAIGEHRLRHREARLHLRSKENAMHVILHCAHREHEPLRDLAVGQSVGDEQRDLPLARREGGQQRARSRGLVEANDDGDPIRRLDRDRRSRRATESATRTSSIALRRTRREKQRGRRATAGPLAVVDGPEFRATPYIAYVNANGSSRSVCRREGR